MNPARCGAAGTVRQRTAGDPAWRGQCPVDLLRTAVVLVLLAACDASPPAARPPDTSPVASVFPDAATETALPEPRSIGATPTPRPSPRLALWVLCEGSQRPLEHPERIDTLVADASTLGVTDLFVQVQRGGQAWYDATLLDANPYTRMRHAAGGADPLRILLATAHARGLRVHAWINVLSLAGNRDAAIVRALGRDAVHVDRRGRSVLDYPNLELPEPDRAWLRMGTPAIWIDPAAPGVLTRLAAGAAELLVRYPELDGLHLDYARHPDVLPFSPGSRFGVGIDFGYGALSRERFRAETGLDAPFGDSLGNAAEWDRWRREKTSDVVRAIASAARTVRPGIVISAAVWAYPERAYFSLMQDWPGWLESGAIDFAVPMLYSRDDHFVDFQLRAYRGIDATRLWAGLGSWLFAAEPARAAAQLRTARAAGLAGVALFSWDALADAPPLRDALAAEVHRAN